MIPFEVEAGTWAQNGLAWRWTWAAMAIRLKTMRTSAGTVDGRERVRSQGCELGGLASINDDLAVPEMQPHPTFQDEEPVVPGMNPLLGRFAARSDPHLQRDRAAGGPAEHPRGVIAGTLRRSQHPGRGRRRRDTARREPRRRTSAYAHRTRCTQPCVRPGRLCTHLRFCQRAFRFTGMGDRSPGEATRPARRSLGITPRR